MRLLFSTISILYLFIGCKPIESEETRNEEEPQLFVNLETGEVELEAGTPREKVIRLSGLSEKLGDTQLSYLATLCGSVEEWETRNGQRFKLQGSFFLKDDIAEKPYVIAIIEMPVTEGEKERILWSGPNLRDGTDIYSSLKQRQSEQSVPPKSDRAGG